MKLMRTNKSEAVGASFSYREIPPYLQELQKSYLQTSPRNSLEDLLPCFSHSLLLRSWCGGRFGTGSRGKNWRLSYGYVDLIW